MNLITVSNGRFEDNGSVFKIVGANNYYMAFAIPAMRAAVLALPNALKRLIVLS